MPAFGLGGKRRPQEDKHWNKGFDVFVAVQDVDAEEEAEDEPNQTCTKRKGPKGLSADSALEGEKKPFHFREFEIHYSLISADHFSTSNLR